MAKHLPVRLNKEPLIDATFEVRFTCKVPASVVIPGLLFNSLDGNKVIESLPLSQLPKPVRDADPGLKYAPLSRIDWGQFFVNCGDNSLSVNCKYPYAGWGKFKPAIITVITALKNSNIIELVERISMKYVDIISSTDGQQKVSMINCQVSIAGHTLVKEPYQLRIEIPRDDFTHAVQVVSSATALLHTGEKKDGLIVDVDTFSEQNGGTVNTLIENFPDKLEAMHSANKAMFFECITETTLQSLEPVYE